MSISRFLYALFSLFNIFRTLGSYLFIEPFNLWFFPGYFKWYSVGDCEHFYVLCVNIGI